MLKSRLMLATAGILGIATIQAMAAMSSTDREFAQKAAGGGLAEVSLGQLAQQNASTQQVKDFGQRMVTDHSQANQELQQIAQQENLTLPTQPDPKDQATEKRFSNLKGAAFDSAYTQDMVRDHREDIAEFQKEARSGQDPALKAFAQKVLPTLQEHLQMAEAITSRK